MFNLVYHASLNLYLWNVSMNLWEPFDLWNIGKDLTLGLMHVNEPQTPYVIMHVCGQIPLWYYACLWPNSLMILCMFVAKNPLWCYAYFEAKPTYDTMHICGQPLFGIVHVLRPICSIVSLLCWLAFTWVGNTIWGRLDERDYDMIIWHGISWKYDTQDTPKCGHDMWGKHGTWN